MRRQSRTKVSLKGNKNNKKTNLKTARESQQKASAKTKASGSANERNDPNSGSSVWQWAEENKCKKTIDVLRQILDNLVLFSFDQEGLME